MPTNNPPNTQSSSSTTSKATSAIQETGARAVHLGEKLEDGAESLASSALERVRDAREQAVSTLEQQRGQLANRVRKFSGVLRASGSLSDEDEFAQRLLEGASERIDRVAEYIDEATADSLASDLNTIARTSPGWFFGGAFVLGLAAGRFVKSSSAAIARAQESPPQSRAQRRARFKQGAERRGGSSSAAQRTSHQEPAYDTQELSGTRRGPAATSTSTGSASGSGVSYSSPAASSPPKPQPSGSSANARSVEPGEGNKS